MSLVGTRPPTVDEWDKYELHHRARLATKPGLTGMWQVSGRSNITDFEEVVKLDKQYISEFKNDIVSMKTKDDVLTYLIHLGYLGYNQERRTAFVPNEEIRQELITAVESKSWNEMLIFQQTSEEILNATLDMDTEEVAD